MTTQKIKNTQLILLTGFFLSLIIGVFTRFVGLTQFPPSLYWEEAALGYDAYSILKTGHDIHGHFLPLVAFESFGDYKPSLYFYTLVPSIAIFGLNDFAVRFPSALCGLLLIVGVGLIGREFDESNKNHLSKLQVIAMLITSMSPWAIEFSRGGWEVNVATTLLTFGIWLQLWMRRNVIHSTQKKSAQFIFQMMVSILLIASSMYTYHATRLVAPVLLLGIWIEITVELWLKQRAKKQNIFGFVKEKLRLLIGAGIVFTVLISPILLSLHSVETQQRFAETSLFADGRQVVLSNALIAQTQTQWLGKILYHRYVISAQMTLENYFTHFTFKFLFLSGDINPRHSTQFVGLMYTGEVVLLFAGLYYLIRKRSPLVYFLIFWLIVGVMPAALTTATPHALRILPSLPVWMIILSCGVLQVTLGAREVLKKLFELLNIKQHVFLPTFLILFGFILFYGWEFTSYWRFYSLIYPKVYASEWQYGYKQMVAGVVTAEQNNSNLPVQITREYGRPSMYYWFYTKTDPKLVQAEEQTAKKDQGEFLQFKNISFVDQVSVREKTLVASSVQTFDEVKSKSSVQVLNIVTDLQNKTVWVVYIAE